MVEWVREGLSIQHRCTARKRRGSSGRKSQDAQETVKTSPMLTFTLNRTLPR